MVGQPDFAGPISTSSSASCHFLCAGGGRAGVERAGVERAGVERAGVERNGPPRDARFAPAGSALGSTADSGQRTQPREHLFAVQGQEPFLVGAGSMEDQVLEAQIQVVPDLLDMLVGVGRHDPPRGGLFHR